VTLSLYTTPLSANGRKVLAVSHHLGLALEVHLVDVYRGEGRAPEYLAINPTGKIPFLVDGEFTLSESNAILQYLSEAHGRYRLFSESPKERAAIASWLFWESAHWQPAILPVLSQFVGHALLPETVPAPSEPPAWHDATLRPLLARLDAHLRDHAFVALDTLTLADFSLGGMMTYFRAAAFPFEEFPGLDAWFGRLESVEAWQKTATSLWTAA